MSVSAAGLDFLPIWQPPGNWPLPWQLKTQDKCSSDQGRTETVFMSWPQRHTVSLLLIV